MRAVITVKIALVERLKILKTQVLNQIIYSKMLLELVVLSGTLEVMAGKVQYCCKLE